MLRKYQTLFLFGILLTVFLNVNSLPALTTSSGTVNFSDSWLSSDPENGVTYTGTRELHPPVSNTDPRQLIDKEEWKPSKPGELITYTLTSRVTGQGTILMSINEKTTKSHDVGTFRPQDVEPRPLTVERDFHAYRVEEYEKLRRYIKPYVPSIYDTCIPVRDKGYNTEIRMGNETLHASGKVTSQQITVSYGEEKSLKKEFNVGGSWPPGGNASFGGGQTDTKKWAWTLAEHSGNTSMPTDLSGSFTVVLHDTEIASSGTGKPGAPCTKCPNCSRSVNTVDDHVIVTFRIKDTFFYFFDIIYVLWHIQ